MNLHKLDLLRLFDFHISLTGWTCMCDGRPVSESTCPAVVQDDCRWGEVCMSCSLDEDWLCCSLTKVFGVTKLLKMKRACQWLCLLASTFLFSFLCRLPSSLRYSISRERMRGGIIGGLKKWEAWWICDWAMVLECLPNEREEGSCVLWEKGPKNRNNKIKK